MQEEDKIQQLQTLVDKGKTVSLINNLLHNQHNLTPPPQKEQDTGREIAIIEGLQTKDEDIYKLYLEARGFEYNQKTKTYEQKNHAYLNTRGALKFVQIIYHIIKPTEFSNFHEDEIPQRLTFNYERDIPEFKINKDLYDLETSDFNWIDSVYQAAIDAAYHKAKGGKYINVVGKTYDEKGMYNLLNPKQESKKETGFLDKINPFIKR